MRKSNEFSVLKTVTIGNVISQVFIKTTYYLDDIDSVKQFLNQKGCIYPNMCEITHSQDSTQTVIGSYEEVKALVFNEPKPNEVGFSKPLERVKEIKNENIRPSRRKAKFKA